MNIPTIPSAACTDPSHAELTMIGLIILLVILARMWWHERFKNMKDHEHWAGRIEDKLDQSISSHEVCQRQLPFKFVTKDEFKELLAERNRQWQTFNEKFDRAMSHFWNHAHSHNGKIDTNEDP